MQLIVCLFNRQLQIRCFINNGLGASLIFALPCPHRSFRLMKDVQAIQVIIAVAAAGPPLMRRMLGLRRMRTFMGRPSYL
jgi:hypothetical protein